MNEFAFLRIYAIIKEEEGMRNDPFSKYDPEVVKTVQRMRLLDNDLMNAVLSDIQCTQLVLHIIMDKPNLIVLAVRTQGAVHNLKGRSVCFDVLATDMIHENLEEIYAKKIQKQNQEELRNLPSYPCDFSRELAET